MADLVSRSKEAPCFASLLAEHRSPSRRLSPSPIVRRHACLHHPLIQGAPPRLTNANAATASMTSRVRVDSSSDAARISGSSFRSLTSFSSGPIGLAGWYATADVGPCRFGIRRASPSCSSFRDHRLASSRGSGRVGAAAVSTGTSTCPPTLIASSTSVRPAVMPATARVVEREPPTNTANRRTPPFAFVYQHVRPPAPTMSFAVRRCANPPDSSRNVPQPVYTRRAQRTRRARPLDLQRHPANCDRPPSPPARRLSSCWSVRLVFLRSLTRHRSASARPAVVHGSVRAAHVLPAQHQRFTTGPTSSPSAGTRRSIKPLRRITAHSGRHQ